MFTLIGVLLLLVAITSLIWKRTKAVSDKSNQERGREPSMPTFPLPGKWWKYLLAGFLVIALNNVFFWAEPGTAYAVQFLTGGDKAVTTQGLKMKWWGRTIPISYETSVTDIITGPEQDIPRSEQGIYNRRAKEWEFSDAIKADIATAVIVGVTIEDEDKFLSMADKNRSEAKLIYGRVLPNIDAALKNTCKLMDAQEYISGKASDFDRYFKDQLENGMYLVEEYDYEDVTPQVIGDTAIVRTVDIKKPGGKTQQKKYRIRIDKQGNIMRDKTSESLSQYGLTIKMAKVTSIDWEPSFDERLDKQKNEVALTQLEKQEAERQYYTTQKEIAKGEAEKASERARLEKEQIKLTIAAETEAKVAEQNVIVERRQLEVEKLKAQSKKVAADAQYYENQKLVQAGLTPQERLEGQIKMNYDKWSQIKSLNLPSTYIEGGGGKGDMGLLEALIGADLAKGMKSKE